MNATRILFLVVFLCAFGLQAKAKRRTHKTKSQAVVNTSALSKRTVQKNAQPGKVSHRGRAKRGSFYAPLKAAQTSRNRQLSPTPDRYREIQEALASKGYLKSQPTGVWDQESTGALRRFQEERNLEATGRVNSLSLIALGLGPKTEAAAPLPAPTPAQPQAEH
ncbi:MAG: peptidoglycan-binding protein [Acidobacteriota bacterium]|nr:peptidoglycan-binding protein [Acidobacteriota bacterium]